MSFARRQPRKHITAGFAFERHAPRVKAKPEPKKRKPIAWRSPKRIQREAVYKSFQDWLHGAGAFCVVCGTSTNIQGSHVGIGGAGLKHGSAADQIRMCGPKELPKNTCNRHDDCDAANAKAKAAGQSFVDHCHDDCCEDCFGS